MRANELMIGDWVYGLSHSPRKVQGLRDYNKENVVVADHWVNCNQLTPIPLTPKILEKNGFYDRNTQWYYKRFWSNGCFDIAVALDYREIEISKVCGSGTDCEEVEYGSTIAFGSDINVHELQHALRLCGLNGLADNFKV